jgi:formate dehydrogenase gamma subunit
MLMMRVADQIRIRSSRSVWPRGLLLAAVFLLAGTVSAQGNEACLGCHGTRDIQAMTTKKGNFFVDPAKHKGSIHAPLGCTTCHSTISEYPHPKRVPKPDCATCHAEAVSEVPKSAHGAMGAQACASCHGSAHTTMRAERVSPKQCATCHADAVRDYQASIHAQLRSNGTADAPNCQSCHGPTHKILLAREPASATAKKNLPATCGSCHANPDFLARHKIPFARPVESFQRSVHGRAVEQGHDNAASCSDCHSSHAIFPARDTRSKINHWKVPETCGPCHTEIQKTYNGSVHGQAVLRGVRGSPVCTDCHGEHSILAPSEPQSLVNPARVSSVTCGRCHADERLAQRYNLPADKVPTFEDSFHGLAMRGGAQTVANCASCHGVHNILPSSDPRSTVHPANVGKTCGQCHPGAGERFTISAVHVATAGGPGEHAVVRWIRVAYYVIIPFTIVFMLLHNAADFFAKLIRGGAHVRTGEQVERMNLHFRIAHWLVVLSFPTLVVTGFALKFPDAWWATPILRWESQFAFRGTVHRFAGVLLVASLVYHVIHLIVSRRDRAILQHLMPGIRDVQELTGVLKHNLGLSAERPTFGKFNYAEKLEYLAFVWGTVVMVFSGFLLWFNNFTLRWFPKWVSDAATAVHYYEAILATLSILIWHFYMVMFDPDVYPMDLAWLTGKASADHLRHTRPAYLLTLLRGQAAQTSSTPQPAEKLDRELPKKKEDPAPTADPEQKAEPARESSDPAGPADSKKSDTPPPPEKKS